MCVSGLIWRCWTLEASKSSLCNGYSWVLLEGREMVSCLTWGFKVWKLSVIQMSPVIWRIVACILHIWNALLPLLFLGQSFLLVKSWWIELLLLASPQSEDWDNCSFFSWMVLTGSEVFHLTSFFILFSTNWQTFLVHAVFLQLHICLLKCYFGIILSIQPIQNNFSRKAVLQCGSTLSLFCLRYTCQAVFLEESVSA